jgi:hypothetical protein
MASMEIPSTASARKRRASKNVGRPWSHCDTACLLEQWSRWKTVFTASWVGVKHAIIRLALTPPNALCDWVREFNAQIASNTQIKIDIRYSKKPYYSSPNCNFVPARANRPSDLILLYKKGNLFIKALYLFF